MKNSRSVARVSCALFTVVTLAVSACSSGTKSEQSSAAATSDSDQVLRAAYQYDPTSLDPHTQTGSYSPVALGLIFDTLIRLTPDGELEPGLATEWAFASDGSTLSLDIREGVTFSDGSALDANAVKVNLDRARGVDFDKSAAKGDLSSITDVTVEGNSVVLALDSGGAELPSLLADRAGMIASPESLEAPDFDQNPVGAGAYDLVSFEPGASLEVERWDGYWDKDQPRNKSVELHFVKDSSTRLRGMQSGQYDWISVDPAQKKEADNAGLDVVAGQTLSYNRITLNRSREWFTKPKVREALSYAVDREALVEGLLFGAGAPAYQPFPEDYWAAAPNQTEPTFDQDKAKALLAEAGYPEGFTFEAVMANSPGSVQTAEAVAAQLAEVGITVNLRPVDKSTTVFYSRKEADAWIGPWGGRSDPAQTLELQYTKGQLQNPGGTASEEIMNKAKASLTPASEEERAKAVQEFTAQVLKEHLDTFLFFPDNVQVHGPKVTGVEIPVSGKPSFRGVIKQD